MKDFTNSFDQGFFEEIFEDTQDLDVSILINNVGMGYREIFLDADDNDIKNTIVLNTIPQALMSKKFLIRMKKRDKKSAIINLSSFLGSKPIASRPIYSATKAYNDFLSRSLNFEHKDKIDILCLRPCHVSSPMTKNLKVGGFTLSPDECAEGALKMLGYESWTHGHWKHSLLSYVIYMIPDFIFQKNNVWSIQKEILTEINIYFSPIILSLILYTQ